MSGWLEIIKVFAKILQIIQARSILYVAMKTMALLQSIGRCYRKIKKNPFSDILLVYIYRKEMIYDVKVRFMAYIYYY